MSLKLYISPQYRNPDRAEGGIRRVVEAQARYLPQFGIEIVDHPDESDLTAVHAGSPTRELVGPVVAHCHGLYWNGDLWPDQFFQYNREVIANLRVAVGWTAPSKWVAENMCRGMLITPRVIYHGVDPSEWSPSGGTRSYVLWNKARQDTVSNPWDVNELAEHLPEIQFVTTFGETARNVRVIGKSNFPEMKKIIQGAGAYLSTTKETFGIGTLEAMASGVPVYGWDWGGNSEIVKQGKTGYLVKPGDYSRLAETIRETWDNRKSLGESARADVEENWTWEARISEYADYYREVYEEENDRSIDVSVIVPCYNLGRYLGSCLESVQRQTFENFECIVVDDHSTDNSVEIAQEWCKTDSRFSVVEQETNQGVAQARNRGFKVSKGKFLLYLDADDQLTPTGLEILHGELIKDKGLRIAYGGIDLISDDGQPQGRSEWPTQFDWYFQIAHMDQIPYCAMMSRAVMRESGGYRSRVWLTEDAEFWTRVTSFGFTARKVTQESIFRYRLRPNSRIRTAGGEGNWEAWFPWSLAKSLKEGQSIITSLNARIHPHGERVPFGSIGEPAKGLFAWNVYDFSNPTISVVVPCSVYHQGFIVDALDSVIAQTYLNWEVVVVDDSPEGSLSLWGHPYARVIKTFGRGPAHARNEGAKIARGEVLVFLDADDVLLPWALDHMIRVYRESEGYLVYTDWGVSTDTLEIKKFLKAPDEVCSKILDQMPHVVTCMVPKSAHEKIGGFDEALRGWEDWDYYLHLAAEGVCSIRLPEPCMIYRAALGEQREKSLALKSDLVNDLYRKWDVFYKGERSMSCSSCGQKSVSMAHIPPPDTPASANITGAVRLTYTGPGDGRQTFRGQSTGSIYRFSFGDTKWVDEADAEYFLTLSRSDQAFFQKEVLEVPIGQIEETAREFSTKPSGA